STPNTNPFSVPGNAAGQPQSFTVVASPYPQGSSEVSIEQCDGVNPATSGWDPVSHCDTFSSPGAVDVGADGKATFPAGDANFGFFPFKGQDSLHRFYCLAPLDPAPTDGKPFFTNCQVRVSTDLFNVTSNQAFLTMTLPLTPVGTSSSSSSSSSSSASSSSSSSSSSSTSAPPPPNMTCHMGDGIPQIAPKPPKNAGLDKMSKGLLPAPAAKDTKHKLTGTLENCANGPV